MGGSYLGEITREVIQDLESSKYQLVEWRLSIYGRNENEWAKLAKWVKANSLVHNNVRWLIQIPRLYHLYRRSDELRSFGHMLQNVFNPLFEISINPSSNPDLHYFLKTVVGIDSVDDESRPEHSFLSKKEGYPTPEQWCSTENPPFAYWMYYTYANLAVLNKLRASRGLNTFQFRPHCGEAGDMDHLIATYLLAHQINHGILLRKNASLNYLYYLSQVGLAMSPLSNNKLFLGFSKNPFPKFFQQGLSVSLSTDDPLMLHITKDALLEEYSAATQVWKLSSVDQCEIARNSVLQSGWEKKFKKHFLGEDFCDIKETNVPEIRLMFRKENLETELNHVRRNSEIFLSQN
jgi:AMP deaminase